MKKKIGQWNIEIEWCWKTFGLGFGFNFDDCFVLIVILGFWAIDITKRK